jgi:NhaP-type Na+/H+ or K+/H+ antiporter
LFGKHVFNQDETPLLYSLVFGERVVNDAMSVVLFNALQNFDLSKINEAVVLKFLGNFCYLFLSSTFLGVFVSSFLTRIYKLFS